MRDQCSCHEPVLLSLIRRATGNDPRPGSLRALADHPSLEVLHAEGPFLWSRAEDEAAQGCRRARPQWLVSQARLREFRDSRDWGQFQGAGRHRAEDRDQRREVPGRAGTRIGGEVFRSVAVGLRHGAAERTTRCHQCRDRTGSSVQIDKQLVSAQLLGPRWRPN